MTEPATRTHRLSLHELRALRRRGALSPTAFRRAVRLATASPDGATWLQVIRTTSLVLAMLNVLGAFVYLAIVNWWGIGRFGQFSIVLGALLVVGVAAAIAGTDRLFGKLCATFAAALIGPAFVVASLAYPPEGQLWTLFAVWAVLALPFVTSARFSPAWVAWIVLVDAVWVAWLGEGLFSDLALSGSGLGVFAIDVVLLGIWELLARFTTWRWAGQRWAPRAVATLALIALVSASIPGMFPFESGWPGVAAIVVAAVAVPALQVAYWPRRDLYVASVALLAGIVILSAAAVRVTFEVFGDDAVLVGWPCVGLTLVVLTVVAAVWIRLGAALVHRRDVEEEA